LYLGELDRSEAERNRMRRVAFECPGAGLGVEVGEQAGCGVLGARPERDPIRHRGRAGQDVGDLFAVEQGQRIEVDPIDGTAGGSVLIWKRRRSDLLKSSSYEKLWLLWWLWGCGQRASVVQAQRHIHSPSAERSGDGVAPHRHRRSVCQRLVRSPVVVKCDPIGDPALGVVAVGVAFEVDVLVFQAAPQPLDEHVVDPATAAVHRDLDAGRRQRAGEEGAGELAAFDRC